MIRLIQKYFGYKIISGIYNIYPKKNQFYIVEPKRIRGKKSCPETSFFSFYALGKKFIFFLFVLK
jgi:hypothetical protein